MIRAKEEKTNIINAQLHPSPFHLDDDWCIICENRNKNCTQKEIDVLIAKDIINHIDLEIMRLLCYFGFINTYNIGYALSYILSPAYKKSSYQRNIQKLVRAGILLKYSIRAGDTLDDAFVSSMHFYSLSAGAQAFIRPHVDIVFSRKLVISAQDIVDSLAVSQLLIHFLKDHGNVCTVSTRLRIHGKGNHSVILDGLIQFSTPNYFRAPTQLALIRINNNIESFSHAADRLLATAHILKEKYSKFDLIIVIIAESVSSIKAIAKFILSEVETGSFTFPYYYTADTLLHTDPLFKSLFKVTFDSKDNVSVINRIQLIPQ